MESNHDEAERCIEIALLELNLKNYEKAEKFLKKAENLYPTQRAKQLLAKVKSYSTFSTANNTRKRHVSPTTKKEKEPEANIEPDYSSDQLEIVKRIKRCKDYYDVLGLTKEATETDIKKAYKKLALLLHPDKNKAPGSVEAFKAVGNAVSTLTDPEKRKAYDMYGTDERSTANNRFHSHQTGGSYEYAYSRGFESDITAEELFNIFFGGGFPQQNVNNRQRRYHNHQRPEGNQQPSLAFGLILVLVVISLMSSFFTSDPIYNLQPSSKYPIKRKTSHFNIPYYVKESFLNEYQGSLERLENSVEEEYITNMKQSCYRERNYREAMLARARTFGSKSQISQAQSLKTPSCDNLYRLEQMIIN